ncbi:hypothetical protein ALC62_06309, partial [Cyphomyrmex costatus]
QDNRFPKLFLPHNSDPLLPDCTHQYRTVTLPNFKIINDRCNNCCGTTTGSIIQIENIAFSERLQILVIIGREFIDKRDFYSVPSESSRVGVFKVKKLSNLKIWPLSEITIKYVKLPYKNYYVVLSILHYKIVEDNLSNMNDNVTNELIAKEVCTDNVTNQWSIVYFETDEEETVEENYDRGMKMLIKIAKNPNATLHSDIEEKGKGKRLKKPIKYFDDSDKENLKKRRDIQSMLPPIPKLDMSKSARTSQALYHKMDKTDINEISKKKNYSECKGVKPKNNSCLEMHKLKSATIISEQSCQEDVNLSICLSSKGCKILPKINHKCAYTSKGKITMVSLADAICYLNAEMLSCKLALRKTDKNMESFLESEMIAKKPTTENSSTIVQHVLIDFPATNLDNLRSIERKLKKEETYNSAVVNALHSQIKGESLQKMVNSVLRIVLDDKLASLFNWKGQRGTKLKLSKRRISQTMIEAVAKEFPTINKMIFGRKAGPWLAQATFRMKKRNNNKDKADQDSCNNSCDSSDEKNDEYDEGSEDGEEDDEDSENDEKKKNDKDKTLSGKHLIKNICVALSICKKKHSDILYICMRCIL